MTMKPNNFAGENLFAYELELIETNWQSGLQLKLSRQFLDYSKQSYESKYFLVIAELLNKQQRFHSNNFEFFTEKGFGFDGILALTKADQEAVTYFCPILKEVKEQVTLIDSLKLIFLNATPEYGQQFLLFKDGLPGMSYDTNFSNYFKVFFQQTAVNYLQKNFKSEDAEKIEKSIEKIFGRKISCQLTETDGLIITRYLTEDYFDKAVFHPDKNLSGRGSCENYQAYNQNDVSFNSRFCLATGYVDPEINYLFIIAMAKFWTIAKEFNQLSVL